jgi:uncharacterized protein (TIGR03086 family)
MTERVDVVFDRGLDVFSAVAERLTPEQWDQPSPCEGWTALDVLGHLTTAVRMGTSVLRGQDPTWPDFDRPADLVQGPPMGFWNEVKADARAALEGADLDLQMDTPMGPRTVAYRLSFPAIDLYVHAWDVGRAAGIVVEIPTEAIDFAHEALQGIPEEMMRGPNGAFGPEVEAPPGATPTEAFMAWTGRDPR